MYLFLTPWIALAITAGARSGRPEACLYAAPFLLLWASAPTIARWLSVQRMNERVNVKSGEEQFLRGAALRTWRYFRENSGATDELADSRQCSRISGSSRGSHLADQPGLPAERPSGGAGYRLHHTAGICWTESPTLSVAHAFPNIVDTFSIGMTHGR